MMGMFCKNSPVMAKCRAVLPSPQRRALLGMSLLKSISLMFSCKVLGPVGQMLLQLHVLEINNRLWTNYHSVFPF